MRIIAKTRNGAVMTLDGIESLEARMGYRDAYDKQKYEHCLSVDHDNIRRKINVSVVEPLKVNIAEFPLRLVEATKNFFRLMGEVVGDENKDA